MIKEKVERRAGESQDKWFVKLQLLKVAAPCSPLLFCSGLPERICAKVQCTNYKWSEKFQVLNLIDRFFLVPLTWT